MRLLMGDFLEVVPPLDHSYGEGFGEKLAQLRPVDLGPLLDRATTTRRGLNEPGLVVLVDDGYVLSVVSRILQELVKKASLLQRGQSILCVQV